MPTTLELSSVPGFDSHQPSCIVRDATVADRTGGHAAFKCFARVGRDEPMQAIGAFVADR
jgi:hypothetical protein